MEGLFRHQHHATPPVWQSLIPRCSRLLDSTTHTAARLPTRWNRLKHSVLERTKKHKCKWPRKQARPTCGAQRWFFFSFLCNSQTVLSRCCSAREPPVESTHRHRGAARCPRCWNVCARSRAGLMLQWVFPPGGPLSSNIFTPSNSNKLQRSWAVFYYREKEQYLRASLPVANTNHFPATTNLVWLYVTNQRMTCFGVFFVLWTHVKFMLNLV